MSDSVGEVLAQARRSLGKSLADAEVATRIRAKLLEALEKGEYDTLPSPAYVRGYIISYARFLELDAKPLLDLYRAETGHATNRERLRLPEQVVAPRAQAHAIPLRATLLIVAVIVIGSLTVWGIGRLIRGPETTPPIPNVLESTSTTAPDGAPSSAPASETAAPSTASTATSNAAEPRTTGESFTVRIRVEEGTASWVRVTVDDLLAYEGTLNGGESKEWQVTTECSVRIGRPSAVTVFRDGKRVEIPSSDTIPELTLSVDSP